MDPCLTPPIPSDLARGRWLPWQIAADIEAAAEAIKLASNALSAIHRSALAEVEAIPGTEFVDPGMYRALIALSDKWQAIADQEEEV